MHILYFWCFTVFVKHSFTRVIDDEKTFTGIRSERAAECGGDVDVSGGTAEIQLPTETVNGFEFYSSSTECRWNIKTSPDHYIIMRSDYFGLEKSKHCAWDYVQIEDGGITSRYSGRDPMTYITASNEIILLFHSDVSFEDKGFKFMLESKQSTDVSKCDSSIIGGEDSKITNNEASGSGCVYRIQAPEDKVIELNLKMLYFGSATCEEESIVVYDGLTSHGELLAKICSDSVHGIQPFHVNMIFIEYRNPLQQEGERFMMEYSFVEDNFTPSPTPSTTPSPVGGDNDCSGLFRDINMQNDEFIYTAPEYADDKKCVVVVRNTMLQNYVVQIEFLYFDIEYSVNCSFDSLRILSGERNDSTMLGGPYCGKSLQGRTFVTSGNSLRLEFKTDVSFALRGFKAKISFVPSTECVCKSGQMCIRQSYEKKCIRGRQCIANPCQNGGTCVKAGSSQKCFCRAGFQGDDCSKSDGKQSYRLNFKVAPTNKNLKRDETHIEECAVEVPPGNDVKYFWTLNGAFIGQYNNKSGFGSYPGGVLKIDKFTDHLEGHYSCLAKTLNSTAEHTFEYRLVEKCDVRIYPGPQSMNKKINEQALLTCHVDKRAKSIRWKKDGVNINFVDKRFKLMVNHYLHITNIQMSDAGTYRCEAEDKNGCFSHKEGHLTVIDVKPLNTYCGVSVHDEAVLPKISKGYAARPNENPWHVTLTFKEGGPFCGGTLISQRYVLTAAHCITEFKKIVDWAPENVYILLGTTNCQRRGNEITRTFKTYIIHPDYGKRHRYDSDIALLELDSPVEYTDAVRPICLEPAAYNDQTFLENTGSSMHTYGKVAGCGKKSTSRAVSANVLQEVLLPYVPREECNSSLEKINKKDSFLTDRMFCAGSNIGQTGDTCKGDSGGGLVMTASSRWVQTGIVSWTVGICDASHYYGVYTHVGMFYDWIENIAKFSEEEVPDF